MPPLDNPPSRPLSEITENEDKRRSIAKSIKANESKDKDKDKDKDMQEPQQAKKQLQTITVNLVEYAANHASSSAPPPPSPSTKPNPTTTTTTTTTDLPPPPIPQKPAALSERTALATGDGLIKHGESSEPSGSSPLLIAGKAALRPSRTSASGSYAEAASSKSHHSPSQSVSSITFDSPRSSNDTAKPPTKAKPSWLRRASMTPGARSKSKSPAPSYSGSASESSLTASASLPPMLPPRKRSGVTTTTAGSFLEQAQKQMLPPDGTRGKSSYATVAAPKPTRSRLSDGQGRPALSPTPPQHPSRGDFGNIRGRLAAWSMAANGSSSSMSKSESSQSLASQTTSAPSAFYQAQQRLPSSAQRVLGTAGSAVSKGWAGLRSRGVSGSISGMSSLGNSERGGSLGPSSSWGSGIVRRGSAEASRSEKEKERMKELGGSDGPVFETGVVKRAGNRTGGKVFGKDLVETGRLWGIADASMVLEGEDDWRKRRKSCLPAIVIRCVDYLELWGPKEEGIFRISGRSSHLSRLRKEFDGGPFRFLDFGSLFADVVPGADIDLSQCHPGDLDPHAVSGIFKSYLRELPTPLLTTALTPMFDAFVKAKSKPVEPDKQDNSDWGAKGLASLVQQLPTAHWFLLAEIVKLLDLIPRHSQTNRMPLSNLMLVLGPTLNIPSPVLNLLLEHRESLFADPPPVSGTESANSIIDFGNTNISPPLVPSLSEGGISSRPTTPASIIVEESAETVDGKSKKVPPKVAKKPSLGRLLQNRTPSLRSKASVETIPSSIVNVSPPRVELALNTTSPLPSFGEPETAVSHIEPIKASIPLEEVNYPSGTVEDRAKLFSTMTPIADMFKGTGAPLLPLRGPKSSGGTVHSSASLPTVLSDVNGSQGASANPASFVRRGEAVFFQSDKSERHGRSHTVSSGTGYKRKDASDSSENSGGKEDKSSKRISLESAPKAEVAG
ncbi:hypothetical protein P7C73_g198, partial [Tremellales sp. Uapishka_1]